MYNTENWGSGPGNKASLVPRLGESGNEARARTRLCMVW